jgi:hypothetical protein
MTAATDGLPDWLRRTLTGHGDAAGQGTTKGGPMDQEPVVVWEAMNMMEAEVVKGRLEAEGIPAIIRSEALGQIFGLTMGGLAKADVLVPGPLAEKALDILEASDLLEVPDETEPEEDAGATSA